MYGTNLEKMSSVDSVKDIMQKLLSEKIVDSVFVASTTPYSKLPMPTLFSDPEKMEGVDPLAPAAPFNASRQAAKILKYPAGKKVAVVLRPCEIRALVELVKLNQCSLDDALIVGIECAGRMENKTYLKNTENCSEITEAFLFGDDFINEITVTCSSCEKFIPETADLAICSLHEKSKPLGFSAQTDLGKEVFKQLGLKESDAPSEREAIIKSMQKQQAEKRDVLFEKTAGELREIVSFQTKIANCLNCYNCRMVCPVCYCKECVFMTDVFNHKPESLLIRSEKKGALKMPTDTSMFHMTRLSHIGHSCIGCGQCSSACPMDIPVADIFRTVSAKTQAFYQYEPGKDVSDLIPQLAFKDNSTE